MDKVGIDIAIDRAGVFVEDVGYRGDDGAGAGSRSDRKPRLRRRNTIVEIRIVGMSLDLIGFPTLIPLQQRQNTPNHPCAVDARRRAAFDGQSERWSTG